MPHPDSARPTSIPPPSPDPSFSPAPVTIARVWYSNPRGFGFGVMGFPEDRGPLVAGEGGVAFEGRLLSFRLDRPVRLSIVHEPPGWVPVGGVLSLAALFAVGGLPPAIVAAALLLPGVAMLLHARHARWVRLEQPEPDGDVVVCHFAPAGVGRYTRATDELLEALRRSTERPPDEAVLEP